MSSENGESLFVIPVCQVEALLSPWAYLAEVGLWWKAHGG